MSKSSVTENLSIASRRRPVTYSLYTSQSSCSVNYDSDWCSRQRQTLQRRVGCYCHSSNPVYIHDPMLTSDSWMRWTPAGTDRQATVPVHTTRRYKNLFHRIMVAHDRWWWWWWWWRRRRRRRALIFLTFICSSLVHCCFCSGIILFGHILEREGDRELLERVASTKS